MKQSWGNQWSESQRSEACQPWLHLLLISVSSGSVMLTPSVKRGFGGGKWGYKNMNAARNPLQLPCCPETDVSAQLSTTKRASEGSLHGAIYLTFIILLFMMFSFLNPMKDHIMGFYCSLFEWIGQWRNNVKKAFSQLGVYLRNVCVRT